MMCLSDKQNLQQKVSPVKHNCHLYLVSITLRMYTMNSKPCSRSVEQSRQPFYRSLSSTLTHPPSVLLPLDGKKKRVEVNSQMPILSTSCCCGT